MASSTTHRSLLAGSSSQMRLLLVLFVMFLVAHVALIGAAMALRWLLGPSLIDLDPKPITASLVRLGKERDEKLLPRKEEAPAPPPEVKAEPAPPAPAAAPTPAPAPAAKASPSAGEKKAEKRSLADIFNKTGKATKAEAPEGSATGDPHGDSAKAEGEQYFALLSAAVRRNYNVANTIPESERLALKALVTLRLGPNGEVLDLSLKSSGNALFDSAVEGAVKAAAPFGPPPDHLRDSLKRTGVTLKFTP